MNWILNSMEESIAASFKYSDEAKELQNAIEAAYAYKRNNAQILELKEESTTFKYGDQSIGNYCAKI